MRRAVRIAIAMGLLGGCGRIHYDAASSRDAGLDASLDAPGNDALTADAFAADVPVTTDSPDLADAAATDAATCPPELPGLLGHWTLDSADVVGTVVRDVSGADRHGTLFGTPAPTSIPGRLGQALDFAGTTSAFIELASVPLDSSFDAMTTISFWLRNENPSADEGVLCMTPTERPEPPRYCLWLTNTAGPLSLCVNGGTGECWGITGAELTGDWVHVVATYANGPTRGSALFLDGVPVTMECEFGTCDQERTIQGPLVLGMEEAGYSWHGALDDVRVFDRALSPAEVAQLYACAP